MAKEPLHLDFSDAETQRNRLSEAQAKSIRDLYREASKEVGKWAERAPRVPSDALRKEYLNRLQGEINRELRGIERQLDGTVRNNMTEVVQATVGDAKAFAQNFGLSIQGAYSHVPTEIVRAIASGQLYEGNWTLSRALWLNTVETQRDVQSIVAKGILENKSAYDIAKDLEKYVNPDARKDWDWSKVYPGTRKVIDYNAQRLARTMVSHAYQQAFVRTTQKNPFITKYEWRAADSERTCQLCLDRDGQYFPKDDLPLDHPNGMCTFLAVIEDDFNAIADRLADWAHGGEDPALDNWAKDLYGKDWQEKKAEPATIINTLSNDEVIRKLNEDLQPMGPDGKPRARVEGVLPKYVKTPFVYSGIDKADKIEEIWKESKDQQKQIEIVNLDRLIATQAYIGRQNAIDILQSGENVFFTYGKEDYIKIYEDHGKYYIVDGHHRCSIAKLKGEHEIRALVLHRK